MCSRLWPGGLPGSGRGKFGGALSEATFPRWQTHIYRLPGENEGRRRQLEHLCEEKNERIQKRNNRRSDNNKLSEAW